jgi:hypothetical protein
MIKQAAYTSDQANTLSFEAQTPLQQVTDPFLECIPRSILEKMYVAAERGWKSKTGFTSTIKSSVLPLHGY